MFTYSTKFDLNEFSKTLDNLFEEHNRLVKPKYEPTVSLMTTMSVERLKDDTGEHIQIALPSLTKEDLELKLENRKLYLEIKTKNKFVSKGKYLLYSLGQNTNTKIESLDAKMENGVLDITLNFQLKEDKESVTYEIT